MERVELHCHSYFGEQDGTVHPSEIANYAKACGMTALALTDIYTVLGYPSFRWATEHNEMKPLYGIEVDGKTVLIKNQLGKKVLYKLISQAARNTNFDLYEGILKYQNHFLLGSGNIFAVLPELILKKERGHIINGFLQQYDFIEVQPHSNYLSLIESSEYEYITCEQDLIDLNLSLIEFGEKYNIPVVATSNSYYIGDDDKLCREVLRSNAGYEKEDDDQHFRTTEEMLAEFPYLTEEKAYEIVVANTNKIADMCECIVLMPMEENYPRKEADAQELDKLCAAELTNKYGNNIPEKIKGRVKWELEALHNTKMEFVILYLYRMIKELELKIYQIGFRGLVGNVYICYLLGITDVDPFKYNLSPYFALGYDKNKELDIDINFSEKNREKAIEVYKHDESLELIPGWLMCMYRDNTDEVIAEYQKQKGIPLSEEQKREIYNRISGLYVNSATDQHGVLMIPKETDIYEFTPVVLDEEGNNIALFEYYSLEQSFYKQDLLKHYGLDILEELEEIIGVVPEKLTFDESEIMEMFMVSDVKHTACKDILDCRTEKTRRMMKKAKIKNFDDLVKVLGLSHGSGTWDYNAEFLLADNKAKINELIGSRDDVFDYLCEHGIKEEIAFKITEQVRKGIWKRGKSSCYNEYVTLMQEANVPDWFIWSCGQISYLFPRAHAIIYAKMNWRLAWYKLNYPDTFDKVNKKHYAKFEAEQKNFC